MPHKAHTPTHSLPNHQLPSIRHRAGNFERLEPIAIQRQLPLLPLDPIVTQKALLKENRVTQMLEGDVGAYRNLHEVNPHYQAD